MSNSPSDRPAPRRGRPPKGTPSLTTDTIVAATLQLIDRDGVESVSMRAVARTLGVDAKSLYNHVDGKDDLLDAVAEHILGTLSFPAPTTDPVADIRNAAHAFRDSALAHPAAAPLVLTRQLTSVRGLGPVDASLGRLRTAGVSDDDVVHVLRFLVATLIGTLLREVNAGPTFAAASDDEIEGRMAEFTASGLPHVVAASRGLSTFDGQSEFDRTLDLALAVIDGQAGNHP